MMFMVSTTTIAALAFSLAASLLVAIILLIYFRVKERISLRAILVGAITFIVFSQVLEKLLHVYVLTQNSYTMEALKSPWPFAFYGALAAGAFEGLGRYTAFQYLLRNKRTWKDGLAFGLGYGGIESMLIGASSFGQLLYFATLINAGTFQVTMGSTLPPDVLVNLENSLITTPPYTWTLGGLERIMALTIQIAMSLFLLNGLRQGKAIYLLWVILIHFFIDFFPGMYQAKLMPISYVEGILALIAIIEPSESFDLEVFSYFGFLAKFGRLYIKCIHSAVL
jgi:uncharacterized membrane protein YhfC